MARSVPVDATFDRMLRSLIDHEEEFRELDAAAGDGDLGITVRSAAAAIHDWLSQKGTAETTSQLLAGVAEVCASTSPSTFGSLISHGLAAAAKALGNEQRDNLTSMVVALEAGIHKVQQLGRAEPGEKTFLDALIPALEAARGATSVTEALPLMCTAAIANTEQMAAVVPKHGRGVGGRAIDRYPRRRERGRHPGARGLGGDRHQTLGRGIQRCTESRARAPRLTGPVGAEVRATRPVIRSDPTNSSPTWMRIPATPSASARNRGTRYVTAERAMSETRLLLTLRAHAHGQLCEGVELGLARLEAEHDQTRNQPEHIAGKPECEKTLLDR